MIVVPVIESTGSVEFSTDDGRVLRARYSDTQIASGPSAPAVVTPLGASDGTELFKIDSCRYFHALTIGTPGVAGSTVRVECYEYFQLKWTQTYGNVSPTWSAFRVDGNNIAWAQRSDSSVVMLSESDGSISFTKTLANLISDIQADFPPPSPMSSTDGDYLAAGFTHCLDGVVILVNREVDEFPDGDFEVFEGALFLCFIDGTGAITTVKASQIALREDTDHIVNVTTLASTTPYIPYYRIDPGDPKNVEAPVAFSSMTAQTLKTRFSVGLTSTVNDWSDGDYLKGYDFTGSEVAGSATHASAQRGGISELGEFVGFELPSPTTTYVILDEDFADVTPGWIAQHQFNAADSTFNIRRPLCRAYWATNTSRVYMIDYATGDELYRADRGINNSLPPLFPYMNTTWLGVHDIPATSPTSFTTLVIEASCVSDNAPVNAPWWIQIDDTRSTNRNRPFTFFIMPHQWRDDA